MRSSKHNGVYYCSIFMEDSRQHKEITALIEDGYAVTCVFLDKNSSAKTEYINCFENKKYGGYVIAEPLDAVHGLANNIFHAISLNLKLLRILIKDREKYQIIHEMNFSRALVCFVVALIFRKKLIYDIFDYFVDSYKLPKVLRSVFKCLDTFLINHASAVFVCTEKRLEQIRPAHPKHIYVIHNTPDAKMETRSNPSFQLTNNGRVRVCYVGLLQPQRPVCELARIISERPDMEFHVGGRGKTSEINCLEELANQHDNIFFYGQLPYEETLYLESQCDILPSIYDPAVPNHRYAASNKFYEALMLGKPLLMIKNTGLDGLVNEYEIGEVAESISGTDIKKALDTLIACHDRWGGMSSRAVQLYKTRFNWDSMKKVLLEAYKEL